MAKILIVEDNPVNLFLYKEVLEKAGKYEVIMSTDGKSVPDIVTKDKPNVIIMDIQLPNTNGIDIYNELKAKCSGLLSKIPVMFVSAEMSSFEISEKSGVAYDRCITKPFNFKQFLSKVESLCPKNQFHKKAQLAYGE